MENYNWISVKVINDFGEWVNKFVRQCECFGDKFISEDGTLYDISRLDFTQAPELPDLMKSFEESNKRFEEQNKEREEMYMKMLSSMDANAIADHKAKIDEREYWRKFRGDLFMQVHKESSDCATMSDVLRYTENYFDAVYNQDKKFFENK